MSKLCRNALLVMMVFTVTALGASAQTFMDIWNFDLSDGLDANGSLAQGVDGNFYGITTGGGANNYQYCFGGSCGTVFKIETDGTLTTLYSFCAQPNCADGYSPSGGLTLGTDGNFYGATQNGGTKNGGTVFRLSSDGMLTTMYSFYYPNGSNPSGALVQGIDGNFYGTTPLGGVHGTFGNIFKITPAGALTNLYSFCGLSHCADGEFPTGGLVQATDGNFYGTTTGGGTGRDSYCYSQHGCGTVFKVTPTGTLTTLWSFCRKQECPDGAFPNALIQARDGKLYGTTQGSGPYGSGTVFRITLDGRFTLVYSFCSLPNCADGSEPLAALIQGIDGNFYGTTTGGGDPTCDPFGFGHACGTMFKLAYPNGTLTTLHNFEYVDGYDPEGALLQATNGTFYGATPFGGQPVCSYQWGCGTIFSFSNGIGPFVTFVRGAAKTNQHFGILGQGFTGTSAVSLKGTPAQFTVKSDTFILATVPPSATTGYVTVITPSGNLTSNKPFYVIP